MNNAPKLLSLAPAHEHATVRHLLRMLETEARAIDAMDTEVADCVTRRQGREVVYSLRLADGTILEAVDNGKAVNA